MSYDWYRRAHESIAQGSLTNSKRVECMIKGVTPTHLKSAQGAFVVDADDKKYIDHYGALGSCLFGYGNPYFKKAIVEQMDKTGFGPMSLGTTLEVELAEEIKNYFPFVEKSRFLKTGTEACIAAVRIACAHTGRRKVLSSGYHGWSDGFVSLTPPAAGVGPQPHFENFINLDQLKSDVACIIIEPIVTDHSQKRLEWLDLVMAKCRTNGILVIFDEIITGFRWPQYSFANEAGRHPDIICLGKACAGGMPLSIVGLGRGIGNGEWFVSSTFAGDPLALAALKTTLFLLTNKYSLKDLWRDGGYFLDEFNAIYPEKIKIEGYPTRGVFTGDPLTKALLWQEACRAGILFGPSFWFSFQHIEHRKIVISTCADILGRIKLGEVKLTGEMPVSPFAQRARESA